MAENRNKLLYSIAKEYYLNNATQKEIAEKFNINRVQVSNYLKEARQKNIVRFEIENPLADENEIYKKKIVENFPVDNVRLAASPKKASKDNLLQVLAEKAGDYLNETVRSGEIIGAGWGSTVTRISEEFECEKVLENISVVPLMGGSVEFSEEFQANGICYELAKKFSGRYIPLLAPFYCDSQKEYDLYTNSSSVNKVMDLWSKLDRVIIGIGSDFSRTPLMKLGGISAEEQTKLLDFRQVGDILTHYFNFQGQVYKLDAQKNLINFPYEKFKKVRKDVIAVAGGVDKKESIAGALNTGRITTIILDGETASRIVSDIS